MGVTHVDIHSDCNFGGIYFIAMANQWSWQSSRHDADGRVMRNYVRFSKLEHTVQRKLNIINVETFCSEIGFLVCF